MKARKEDEQEEEEAARKIKRIARLALEIWGESVAHYLNVSSGTLKITTG